MLAAAWLLSACSAVTDSGAVLDPGTGPGGAAGSTGGLAGQSGVGGASGAAGVAGTASVVPAAYDLKGYFDLTFASVESKLVMGPPDVSAPSSATSIRIDLHEPSAKGDWQAVVTPRWGQPSVFQAKIDDGGALVLQGTAKLTSTSSQGSVTDVWEKFSFQTHGNKLTGVVGAEGQQNVVRGDTSWPGTLTGSGQIVRDATPPEGRAGLPGQGGPDGKLLPWEPLRVALAEPVASSELLTKLSPSNGKNATSVSWSASSDAKVGDLVSALVGYRQSWQASGATLATQLLDGFVDPAGNQGKGFLKDYDLADVPQVSLPLGGDSSGPLLWGAAASSDGNECEGKPCLAFGPFTVGGCVLPEAGAALRLASVPDGASLRLRMRAYTTPALLAPSTTTPGVLTVETARVGQAPVQTSVPMPTVEACSVKDEPQDDLSVCSKWVFVDVAVPPGAGEVGVAMRSATGSSDCSTAKPAGSTARVVVNAISVVTPGVY